MMDGETCWTLLRDAASGDEAARARFVSMYSEAIQRFLVGRWRGRKLKDDASDAAQDILVECFRVGGVLEKAQEGAGEFRGLLYTVCRNVARRYEARFSGAVAAGAGVSWLDAIESDEVGQSVLFDKSWAQAIVKRAAVLQKEMARADGEAGARRVELLDRRFNSGEPIRDIARAWGVPAQDVHNLYRKARGEFRQCLREVVAQHTVESTDVDEECQRLLGLL